MFRNRRHSYARALVVCLATLAVVPTAALAQSRSAATGGSAYTPPPPPAKKARIVNGIAIPPKSAPARVKRAIAAANRIVRSTYIYGGGHDPYSTRDAMLEPLDKGYDCSSAISFPLFGGRFLKAPLNSSGFMDWGIAGKGRWITVYTNPGHAYIVIAGLRLDTSAGTRSTAAERASGRGPRWRRYPSSTAGYRARHPKNY